MKYLLLCLAILFPGLLYSQPTCCVTNPNAKFASFASSSEFVNSHALPLPFVATGLAGKMISFKCPSGAKGAAYFVKSTKDTDRVILMFHEFWGLNDYIKKTADSMSKELHVSVCAVDLYDGKVALTREEAKKYVQELKQDRGNAIIDGVIAYFGKNMHFGTIGWCMGGGWSMQAALRAGNQADACVIYYGMPETDPAKLANLHAPVLGIFAAKDEWITPEIVDNFKTAMKQAGRLTKTYSYDANHGFANPSNPDHDKTATDEAMKHVSYFFKKNLQLFQ